MDAVDNVIEHGRGRTFCHAKGGYAWGDGKETCRSFRFLDHPGVGGGPGDVDEVVAHENDVIPWFVP